MTIIKARTNNMLSKENSYSTNKMNADGIAYAIDHVVTGGGNCTAQGKCWYEDICPTLKSAGVHAVLMAYDRKDNGS